MELSRRDLMLLLTAVDHYVWYRYCSTEEKEEYRRLKRILRESYRKSDSKNE